MTFTTTADLPDLDEVVGQARAVEALRFGLAIRRRGFHLVVQGIPGSGRHALARRFAGEAARAGAPARDQVYVTDFGSRYRPRALSLPPGSGAFLRRDVDTVLAEFERTLRAAFEGEAHCTQRRTIERASERRRARAMGAVARKAARKGLALVEGDGGFGFAPTRAGKPLSVEAFARMPEKSQRLIEARIDALEGDLQAASRVVSQDEMATVEVLRALDYATAAAVVKPGVEVLQMAYRAEAGVVAWLDTLAAEIITRARDFLPVPDDDDEDEGPRSPAPVAVRTVGEDIERGPLRRYRVNLFVGNTGAVGAPVVYEPHPTVANLFGRVDYVSHLGSLVTDFLLVRAGGLQRANGGYLLLDLEPLVANPAVWEALSRALRTGEVRPEGKEVGEGDAATATATLEPAAIPLDVKVVLIGDRAAVEAMEALDPGFDGLFKVVVDLDDDFTRDAETEHRVARWLATLCRSEVLRTMDTEAVARVVEHGARLAGSAEKLTARFGALADLAREADHLAGVAGHATVTGVDVLAAESAAWRRSGRLRAAMQHEIRRGVLRIETTGARVGQVNGLAVQESGRHAYGLPLRLTATARVGRGEVIDVEREVELSGPAHSKGVLILAGFLGARYAETGPLSLHATLVFEQMYNGVDGDSASAAELCALLSVLADLPLRQSLAITGSVDQLGRVQAVGGVTEKVEGFFDLCAARGLDGQQGVVLPVTSAPDLMLRDDVVEAARAGRFAVYPVATVDEAIELLTGVPAGIRDDRGVFPAGTVNARVEARLMALTARRGAFRDEEG